MVSVKGQISLEYMITAIILTAALIFVFASAFSLFQEQKLAAQASEARAAANDLAELTNFLCTTPRNTTAKATVSIPPLVDLSKSSVDNRTIKFQMKTREAETVVTATTGCNVTGTLPSVSGTYTFRGVSQGGSGGSVALNYTPEVKSLRPSSG